MAAGDINDALTQIPGVAIADDSVDPTDLGAGYALLKFKNGTLVWLPTGGAVCSALALGKASQLAGLTAEASPADADLFLMERASDGALRKVQAQNLPGGGATGGLGSPVDWASTFTLTQGVGLTLLDKIATYQLSGKLCLLFVSASINSSGTDSNPLVLGGIPDAVKAALAYRVVAGAFMYRDASANVYRVGVPQLWNTGNQLYFYVDNADGPFGVSPSFQAVAGDAIAAMLAYNIP